MKKLTTRTRLHNDLAQISSVFIVKRNISMQVSKTLQNWSAKKNLSRNFDWMPSSSFQFLLHFGRFFVLCYFVIPPNSILSLRFVSYKKLYVSTIPVVYNCILHANNTGLLLILRVWFSSLRTFSYNFFVIVYAWYMCLFLHDQLSYSAAHLCFSWETILPLPHLVINNYKGPFWKLLTSSCSFSRFDIDWMHSQF